MKKCSNPQCSNPLGIELDESEFYKDSTKNDGLEKRCKHCRNANKKDHYLRHQEDLRVVHKAHYIEHRNSILEQKKEYHKTHKEYRCQYNREFYEKNKDKIRVVQKQYKITNRENLRKKWAVKKAHRLQTNPLYRLKCILSARVRTAIKGQYGKKAYRTVELLGCTIEHSRTHLESLFQDGMTWENHGTHGWHIDHIKPCAAFDLTDPEQQKQCFHYTNLQPLWAEDNLKKSDKFV